jgi:hypothetical protein
MGRLLAALCWIGLGGCSPSADDALDARLPEDVRDDGGVDGAVCVPRAERCGSGGEHEQCAADGSGWSVVPCPGGLPCDGATGRCACPAGSETTLTGRVLLPNGREPVSRALVYVPVGEPTPPPAGPHCQTCIDTSGFAAWTETAADGTFRLTGVPAGSRLVVVEKGYFQRVVPVEVEACVAAALEEERTRLPRDGSEGYLPYLAVVTGSFDRMEDVLAQLGLAAGSYDVFEGVFCDGGGCDGASALLTDLGRLLSYHVVFLNCGMHYDLLEVLADREDVRENVRAYVRQGGRLYVTDQSYDFIEQALPSLFDFAGSDAVPVDEPETHGYAQCGYEFSEDGIAVPGEVLDAELLAWLEALGVTAGPRIELTGFLRSWAVLREVSDPARGRAWVDGLIPRHDWQCVDGRHPMTVSADVECGKVLYSSYHTVEGSAGELPQEKVLMYLALEIGTCLEEIIPFI